MTDKKTLWNEAAKAGVALGMASITYQMCTWGLGNITEPGLAAGAASAAAFILWGVKFAGCILLMKHFMKKYVADEPDAGNFDSFRFGAATAVLSAVLFAGFNLAFYSFIQPDAFNDIIDTLRGNPMINGESIELLEGMAPKYPTISFFSSLIYCSLFGTVLSAILSRNIPSRNPFEK